MSIRKIDAYALMKVFRDIRPEVWEEDNGYDQGALDMRKLLYSALKSAPTLPRKESEDEEET